MRPRKRGREKKLERGMPQTKAELKAALTAKYNEALDELLEASEHMENFAELEEAVRQLAEKTLPATAACKARTPACVSRLLRL